MQCYVIIKFKWHNLKVKTVDKLFDIYNQFPYLSVSVPNSRFHTLTGKILSISENNNSLRMAVTILTKSHNCRA